MTKLLIASILATTISFASAQGQSMEIAPIVGVFEEQLSNVRSTIRKLEEAPEPGLFTYFDKEKYQKDLDKLLDAAFEKIAPDLYANTREELLNLDKVIADARRERSEYMIKEEFAPSVKDPSITDTILMRKSPKGSKEYYRELIAEVEQKIGDAQKKRSEIINGFMGVLAHEYDVTITEKQAEAALYQLNGSSIVESVLVGKIVLDVEKRLRTILSKDVDMDTSRKYHGIAAITHLLILRMHERHLASYEENGFRSWTNSERKTTGRLLRSSR